MKNILLTFCFLFVAGVSYSQIKVIANGNVGMGVTNPTEKLEVDGNSQSHNVNVLNPNGNTSRIRGNSASNRLEVLNNVNTTNSQAYFSMFGNDVNNPSRSGEFTLAGKYIRIFKDNSDTGFGTEGMRIQADGDVGIGITNPSEKLHVGGNILATGTVTSSDRRLKNNIKNYNRGLEDILSLTPKSFSYNGKAGIDSDRTHIGLIAQELKEVAPELVGEYHFIKEDIDRNVVEEGDYYYIDDDAIKYMLINAVQEQNEIISAQAELIEDLQQRMIDIENSIAENQSSNQDIDIENPSSAFIKQNTPNPFKGETQIEYFLPENASEAYIQFYNEIGQLLKSEYITNTGKGVLNVSMNDIPSGVYSYSLTVDGKLVSTKRMVVSK